MNYSKPLHVALREARLNIGISQKELSEMTGITRALISKYESGVSKPRAETIQRLSVALKTDLSNLLQSTENHIPFIQIGYRHTNIDDRFFTTTIDCLRENNIYLNTLFAYVSSGYSMSPTIIDNDRLLIDESKTTISDGSIYLISHGGLLMIKRLYNLPLGGVRIVSDNAIEFPEIRLTAQEVADQFFSILGKVVLRQGFL